jgi:3-hydroxyisobutyrate dehydrogenase-like beta-hydroxyacid dehydrogenase
VLGIVGVGRMGGAMLPRLAAGRTVIAHDVVPSRCEPVRAAGARWSASLRELAEQCDVLVTTLPGPEELRVVMAEALPVLRTGTLWIDCTSGDPRLTASLAEAAGRRGIEVVAAPMGGSVGEAASGSLTFFVSGDGAAVERARPVLRTLAAEDGIRQVGQRVEDGQVVKLLANALWFVNATAGAEALLIGAGLGVEPERLRALLDGSAGGSAALTNHVPRLLDGDYLETFGLDRVVEELRTVRALGTDSGSATPVLDASADLHEAALERFGPALGELLGARLLEERTGRRLRRGTTDREHHRPD